MEFLKKHKKAFLIVAVILFVLILFVWFYQSKKAAEPASSDDKKSDVPQSAEMTIPQRIQKKMDEIRNFPEWYDKILATYESNNQTLQQALANAAIWGLKVDKIIPMDTYGAGEWGHLEYVKANY